MTPIFLKNILDKQLIGEDNSDYRIRMEVFKNLILNFKYLIFKGKIITQGNRLWTKKEREEKTVLNFATRVSVDWEITVWFVEESKVLAEHLHRKVPDMQKMCH